MNWIAKRDFCFTGKARWARHVDVTRGDLEEFVMNNGGYVHKSVTARSIILVSSLDSTVKADAARRLGCEVIGYDEFFARADIKKHSDLMRVMHSDFVTQREQKRREAQERVEAKRATFAARRAELEEAAASIEGWGTF